MMYRMTVRCAALLFIFSIIHVKCAPPQARQQLGPCVGMDCMHGVLMHGDNDQGDDHKSEDKFQAIQNKLEAITGKEKSGPCEGMDCMHGVLMHNDNKEGVEHMHQKMGPDKEVQQAGPGEGMEFLHGVMMHGDGTPGKDHEHDHKKLTQPPRDAAASGGESDGPCVGMDCLHGVLMHGDNKDGEDHSAEHEHDKKKLHEKLGTKFNSPDIETAIHGVDNHDHHDPNKKPEVDERKGGVPSVSDPHETIHGHLNKQIQLGKAPEEENEGYLSWLRTSKKKTDEKSGGILGFSFPFISDSLLDEIEILKRRYLPRFWSGSDGRKPVDSSTKKEKEKEREEVHELLADLDVVGDTGPVKDHGHQHHPKDTRSTGEGSGIKHDEG